MRLINIDDETLDLLEAAAEMMHAAMSAREKRFPADHLISRTAALQRLKMQTIMQVRNRPSMRGWKDFTSEEKSDVIKLATAIADAPSGQHVGDHITALLAIGMGSASMAPPVVAAQTPEASEIRGSEVSSTAAEGEAPRA